MVCSLDETMNTFMETCNDTEMNATFNFSLIEVYAILLEHRRSSKNKLDKNTEVNAFFSFYGKAKKLLVLIRIFFRNHFFD